MTFWDSVKNVANEAAGALTNAANDVTNSARDYNEKSKLKQAIRVEEGKIDNCFKQTGEEIYTENSSAPSGFGEQFDRIGNAKKEIERLKAELAKYEK